MNILKLMICILMALILTACSGSSESTASTVPLKISLLGDSIAKRFSSDILQSQPSLPQGSVVENLGRPGLCTIEGYDWTTRLIQSMPRGWIGIYFSGINDARRCGTSVDNFASMIKGLSDTARSDGKRFIVVTPNPTFASPENELLSLYANAERKTGVEIFDLRLLLETTVLPFDYGKELAYDGTHLTPTIYNWMAPLLIQKILTTP